ncbi:MAG: hypothetical protein MUC35_06295 [Candidatus Margulisbacteria bacterium]|jgi:hypothetical protein|nr:hypothetical protein [Candidatus Margulisiibacteriota bacterium]
MAVQLTRSREILLLAAQTLRGGPAKLARTTRDIKTLLYLAEQHPGNHAVQGAVFANPAAQKNPFVLAAIEDCCRDKISKLPGIVALKRTARETTDLAVLAKIVCHPLRMVRLAAYSNVKVLELATNSNSATVLREIATNVFDPPLAHQAKALARHNPNIPYDVVGKEE